MRPLLCLWRQWGPNKATGKTQVGGKQRKESIQNEHLQCIPGRGWKALGYLPTYCRVGVGAEHRVLPDDTVQLERGEPGHEDHGG
jgi:hypothetical protein